MKSIILTFFVVLAAELAASAQTILLVDNTPNKPSGDHVYSSLQVAVDSASEGDIIHVKPSETSYGSVRIKKSITIYGIGFNPNKDIPKLSTLANLYLDEGSSNTRISGLVITDLYLGDEVAAYTISNIQIDNNRINRIILDATGSTARKADNVLIRNNLIGASDVCCSEVMDLNNNTYNSISNVVITNNIIIDYSSSGYGAISGSSLLIKNNLFYGNGSANYEAFEIIRNSTISNNIFFGNSPEADNTSESNVFNNNLTTSTTNDSLPSPGKLSGTLGNGNGNTGGNNLQTVNPLMTNLSLGTTWVYTNDITPQAGSPLLNAGTDGTNIGPTGGTTPWDNTGVVLPLIQTIIANDVVKQGDNLNVEVQAEGNN